MDIVVSLANPADQRFMSKIIYNQTNVRETWHSSSEPDKTRSKIIIKVEKSNINNKSNIKVQALGLFMYHEDQSIKKNKLNYLLVDSGSHSDGTWTVKGIVSKG